MAATVANCLPEVACSGNLKVRFGDHQPVVCGSLLNDDEVQGAPRLELCPHQDVPGSSGVTETGHLLVVMVDPDAPDARDCPSTYWLHWIAKVNIQNGVIKVVKPLIEYSAPSPPPRSGPHRYQLMLYHAHGELHYDLPRQRSNFLLEDFMREAGIAQTLATFQFSAFF